MTDDGAAFRTYMMAKLRRLRPDLHTRVVNGDLLFHDALVQAGIRHRFAPMRVDDVHKAVGTLLKFYSADSILTAFKQRIARFTQAEHPNSTQPNASKETEETK